MPGLDQTGWYTLKWPPTLVHFQGPSGGTFWVPAEAFRFSRFGPRGRRLVQTLQCALQKARRGEKAPWRKAFCRSLAVHEPRMIALGRLGSCFARCNRSRRAVAARELQCCKCEASVATRTPVPGQPKIVGFVNDRINWAQRGDVGRDGALAIMGEVIREGYRGEDTTFGPGDE